MPYTVRIEGIEQVYSLLNRDFSRAVRAATDAVAQELEDIIAPYPPPGIANSPENPMLRWYQRGYGPRWWVMNRVNAETGLMEASGAREYLMGRAKRQGKRVALGYDRAALSQASVNAQAKKGRVHGRKSSQLMNRQWDIVRVGRTGAAVVNRATYAKYLHDADVQAPWAAQRGWISDRRAIEVLQQQGSIERIVLEAVLKALKPKAKAT